VCRSKCIADMSNLLRKECPDCGETLEGPVFDATTRVRDGRVTVDHRCGSCGEELTLRVEEGADWLPGEFEEDISKGFRLVSKQDDRSELYCPECGTSFDGAVFTATTETRGGRVETVHECPDCYEELLLMVENDVGWVPERFTERDELRAERLFVSGMKKVAAGVTAIFLTTLLISYTVGIGLPERIPESVAAVIIALVGVFAVLYVWYGLRRELDRYFDSRNSSD